MAMSATSSRANSSRGIRVAIVGAGIMGRWHGDAARRAGAQVVAVVDSDRRRAEALAARYRGCRPFSTLGDSLDLVDIVHVCTPTDSHAPLARQALVAGRHVLLEKPLAPTAAAAEELIALARSCERLLCPVHQFLFQHGTRAALRTLATIGPLHHVDVRMCSAGGAGLDSAVRDRIAYEILPHPLALLARLLPGCLPGVEWDARHPQLGEIRALGQLGRVTVSLVISMGGRPNINRVDLIAHHGTIHVDWFHGFAVLHAGRVSGVGKLARPFTSAAGTVTAATVNLVRRTLSWEPAYPGLRALVAAFYAAVRGTGAPPISDEEMLDVARACDSLRAALSRGPVPDRAMTAATVD